MPAHHGLWRDHDEVLFPRRPEAACHDPEQPVERLKIGPGMLTLPYDELLSEREIFQEQVSAGAKDANECSEPKPQPMDHEQKL